MKIAFVTHTFSPEFIGGRENHIRHLAKSLSKKHEVFIYTGSNVKKAFVEKKEGYVLCNLPMLPITMSRNPLQIYRIIPKLYSYLKKEKFDIVHAFEYGCFSTDIACLYSRIYKVPFYLTVYGYVIDSSFLQILKRTYDFIMGRLVLNTAEKIICVSDAQRRGVMRLSKSQSLNEKIVVMGNYIDVDGFDNIEGQGREIFGKYNLNPGPVLLAIGRILPRKGFNFLISAMKKIVARYPEINLLLVGPDMGELSNLRNLAADLNVDNNVFFVGPVDRESIKSFYAVCDIFVHPAVYEGLPLVLLEAMACGKPVLATKLDGIQKAISDRHQGLLISPESSNELANGVFDLLDDSSFAARLGEEAKKRVAAFDIKNEVINLEKIYSAGI